MNVGGLVGTAEKKIVSKYDARFKIIFSLSFYLKYLY